jgi:hypothetical protein
MTQQAYAAYHAEFDWIPLSSIKNDPKEVEVWVNNNYVSRSARDNFIIVDVCIKVIP